MDPNEAMNQLDKAFNAQRQPEFLKEIRTANFLEDVLKAKSVEDGRTLLLYAALKGKHKWVTVFVERVSTSRIVEVLRVVDALSSLTKHSRLTPTLKALVTSLSQYPRQNEWEVRTYISQSTPPSFC